MLIIPNCYTDSSSTQDTGSFVCYGPSTTDDSSCFLMAYVLFVTNHRLHIAIDLANMTVGSILTTASEIHSDGIQRNISRIL